MEPLLFIVLLVAIIAFLFFRPSLANRKGKRGEKAAAWYLHRLPSEYVVYSDIMLQTNYGTTQIDHLVVSPYGVFVIEVKNMQGIISVAENWYCVKVNMVGSMDVRITRIVNSFTRGETLLYLQMFPICPRQLYVQ